MVEKGLIPLAKLFISSAVGVWDLTRQLNRDRPGICVVVNYHAVTAESLPSFRKQLESFVHSATIISATRSSGLRNGCRYVAITVDDVFMSFVENALPEICDRKFPVTLFPPTGFLGKKSSWTDYGGPNPVGELVVSKARLREIACLPDVELGSHSVNHLDLPRLSAIEAREELRTSKETLEEICQRPVISLSFPYGSFGMRELELAGELGYVFCFNSTPQTLYSKFEPGAIGRVDIQPEEPSLRFKLKTMGAYRWIRQASALKQSVRASTKILR
jgi:peptidoglycan/xylan/chitin deacetylase (PgdA/CDA1 family)